MTHEVLPTETLLTKGLK